MLSTLQHQCWVDVAFGHLAASPADDMVIPILWEALKGTGVAMASYHFAPSLGSQVGENLEIVQFGFPPGWVELYTDPAFRACDPIPDHVMQIGAPCTWSSALESLPPSADKTRFAEAATSQGIIDRHHDGISIPLYGPGSRGAYFSVSHGRRVRPSDWPQIFDIMQIAQAAHGLIAHRAQTRQAGAILLSEREHMVLRWLAAGKSKTDVSTILSIAPATTDTYVRRIYQKLGANNRVEAILAAIANGVRLFA